MTKATVSVSWSREPWERERKASGLAQAQTVSIERVGVTRFIRYVRTSESSRYQLARRDDVRNVVFSGAVFGRGRGERPSANRTYVPVGSERQKVHLHERIESFMYGIEKSVTTTSGSTSPTCPQ